MSLRQRITLLVTFMVVSLLLLSLVLVRQQFSAAMDETINRQMETINSTVGVMLLPILVTEGDNLEMELAEIRSILSITVRRHPDLAMIELQDADHHTLVRYPDELPAGRLHERTMPIRISEQGRTRGFIRVAFDPSGYEAAEGRLTLRVLMIGAAFAFFGLIASLALAGTITRPLERLCRAAAAFGRGDYEVKASEGMKQSGRDEIAQLAVAFDEMAVRIRQNIARLKTLQVWSREVAGRLDLNKVLEITVEAFREVGAVSKMSIMLFDEATETLEIKKGLNLTPGAESFVKFKRGEGAAGQVLATGKPLLIEDMSRSREYHAHSGKAPSGGQMLVLPLIASGGSSCLGVVNLHEKTDGTPFDVPDQSLLMTLSEIVAVAIQNARNYDMAISDGLTHLYIQRYFQQRLDQEMKRSTRVGQALSLLMTDIDHFKSVNDTYGHQVGDAVLIALAKVMRHVFRETDITCRYGGEEFAVIMLDTDQPGSVIAAERFRRAVESHPFLTSAGQLKISVSCGLSTFHAGLSKAEFIHEADKALYAAKHHGRNCTIHIAELS